jgi:hypothetical protein
MMKKTMLGALAILVVCAAPVLAGKNNGGAMVVHTVDAVVYTPSDNYCLSTLPATCAELNPTAAGGIEAEQVIWLIAAFDPTATPAVTTVQFGINHNLPQNQGYITAFGACGPSPLELADQGWPESGFGNLLSVTPAVTEHLWAFYWFAIFVDNSGNHFGTAPYPGTNEAKFVDDSNPPAEDLVTRFGTVNFGGEPGTNACPVAPARGACCTSWGSCVENLDASTCEDLNGTYQGTYSGDNTTCAGTVCAACCYALFQDLNQRRCKNTTETYCYDKYSAEGSNEQFTDPSWAGAGNICTLAADSASVHWYCAPTPTRPDSWGVIKALFR